MAPAIHFFFFKYEFEKRSHKTNKGRTIALCGYIIYRIYEPPSEALVEAGYFNLVDDIGWYIEPYNKPNVDLNVMDFFPRFEFLFMLYAMVATMILYWKVVVLAPVSEGLAEEEIPAAQTKVLYQC